jgi:inhibitor of cysteine peptidase
MRRQIFYALVAVTLAVIAANAAAQQSYPPTAPATTTASDKKHGAVPQMIVESKDNGRQITLKPGAFLLVRLEANPSTGYSWTVIGDPAPLSFVSSKNETAQQNQQRPGAPGMQVLRFKASSAGTVDLKIGYRRPWEKEVAPAKTFQIHVTVAEAPSQ